MTETMQASLRPRQARKGAAFAHLFAALLAFATAATGQTTIVFDADPGATGTRPISINAGGDVTGWWLDGNQGGKRRSFVRERNGNVVVFDADPAAVSTTAFSINAAGAVTGSFRDGAFQTRGFVRDRNGNVVVFDAGSSVSINAGGDVTGIVNQGGTNRGFVRERNGNIVVFDADPAGTAMQPASINARGDVTGWVFVNFRLHGFVRDRNGDVVVFDADPAATFPSTTPTSINAAGDVTGNFGAPLPRGFLRKENGNLVLFDADPAGFRTMPRSINDAGAVTGWVTVNSSTRGFVRDRNGNTVLFDADLSAAPSPGTRPASINAGGDVTGDFRDVNQSGKFRGFVRSRQ